MTPWEGREKGKGGEEENHHFVVSRGFKSPSYGVVGGGVGEGGGVVVADIRLPS